MLRADKGRVAPFRIESWRLTDIALVLGPRSTTKTVLIKSILSELESRAKIVRDITSENLEQKYDDVFSEEEMSGSNTIVVLDDITTELVRSERFKKFILNGRHYKVGFLILQQKTSHLPRWLLNNADLVLMLKSSDEEVKMWCDNWLFSYPEEIRPSIVQAITKDSGVLIFDAVGKPPRLEKFQVQIKEKRFMPSFTKSLLTPNALIMCLVFLMHQLNIFKPYVDVCSVCWFTQTNFLGCAGMYLLVYLLVCTITFVLVKAMLHT